MHKILSLLVLTMTAAQLPAEETQLFLGTAGNDTGILTCSFNPATGAFGEVTQAAALPSAGFLAQHPTLPRVYSITRPPKNKGQSAVAAYAIQADGSLKHLASTETGDVGITHLAVSPNGKHLGIAHYSGGSTALLPLDAKGLPHIATALVHHTGSSVNPKRQQKPFAHGVAFSADSARLYCADLGADTVLAFAITPKGDLSQTDVWKATPGAGPRHLALHPNGTTLYSINELNSTLTRLDVTTNGKLIEQQTITTLPPAFTNKTSTAEVVVHPSGQFVFGSNRGHDSLAAFRIASDGTLSLIEIEPTQGGHPRHIALSPDGKWLIAANRDDNTLVSFAVNPTNGALTPSGHTATAVRPICVIFRHDK